MEVQQSEISSSKQLASKACTGLVSLEVDDETNLGARCLPGISPGEKKGEERRLSKERGQAVIQA